MLQQKDCNFGSGYQKGLYWDGNLTYFKGRELSTHTPGVT